MSIDDIDHIDDEIRKLSAFAELLQNQNEIVNTDTIRTIGSMIDDSARKIKGIMENENV
jgi:16S rRNA G527 N7-methylase RsmG